MEDADRLAGELSKLLESVTTAARKAEGGDPAERVRHLRMVLPYDKGVAFARHGGIETDNQCCNRASNWLITFVQDRAIDGLKMLRQLTVDTKILAETQAGKRVRVVTKHRDKDIAEAAQEVVARWKAAVRRESVGTMGSIGSATSSGLPSHKEAHHTSASVTAATTITSPVSKVEPLEIPLSGDVIRDKCRKNLALALQKVAETDFTDTDLIVKLAVEIESALFNSHKGVTPSYKAKFRQLHFNLKDEKNPDLRRRVVNGTISPEVLITLSPEELASDAKREENQRIRDKKLFDSAPSAAQQATTDQFQCGKCRQRKCTYYQMQTRSADEPMTT